MNKHKKPHSHSDNHHENAKRIQEARDQESLDRGLMAADGTGMLEDERIITVEELGLPKTKS